MRRRALCRGGWRLGRGKRPAWAVAVGFRAAVAGACAAGGAWPGLRDWAVAVERGAGVMVELILLWQV